MQRDYWNAMLSVIDKAGGPISGKRKAQPQSWMAFPVGRTNFNLGTAMTIRDQEIRTELYLSGSKAKEHFALLCEDKEAVELDIGYPLLWEELPNGPDSRISVRLGGVNPKVESDWARQHKWLVTKLHDMHRIFAERIRMLDAEE